MTTPPTTPAALVTKPTRVPLVQVLRAIARGLEDGRYVQHTGGMRIIDNGNRITIISDLKLTRLPGLTSPPQPAPATSPSQPGIRLCWTRAGETECGPWVDPSQEKYVRRACEGLNMMFGAGTHWVELQT